MGVDFACGLVTEGVDGASSLVVLGVRMVFLQVRWKEVFLVVNLPLWIDPRQIGVFRGGSIASRM